MSKKDKIIYKNPLMMPEIVGVAHDDQNNVILRFGYKEEDNVYIINSSYALPIDKANKLIEEMYEAMGQYSKKTDESHENN